MWSFLLVFGLLCWGSHGSVTCRNDHNAEVDWYVIYKVPKGVPISTPRTSQPSQTSGTEYIYIDSRGKKQLNNIESPNGVLANTLRPLLRPIRNMAASFGFISYSDQPPGCAANVKKFGHSKGIVMMERSRTGVWLLHSTPWFPFRRELNSFWPNTGNKNAQTFMCVTFNYDKFSTIGIHLQNISAFPYEHYIPDNFHEELQTVVKWTEDPPARKDDAYTALLTSRGNQVFKSIAKNASDEEEEGDLYLTIASRIATSDVYVQTWGCQRGRSDSYCPETGVKVNNVEDVAIRGLGTWKPKVDHSKWCVAADQNKHWTCIADVNRAVTQYERFGGALCINHQKVQEYFLAFAKHPQNCRKRPHPVCDPDADGDGAPSLAVG